MKFEGLQSLNQAILATREPGECETLVPVVNTLLSTQRYLIISSDPSSDTDKTRDSLERHSGFEERVLALAFYGTDDAEAVSKVRPFYGEFKSVFLKNFYWTHYSKVYAKGNPGSFWADRFLLKEIELFDPECMIVFGSIVTKFLFGKGRFIDRVNKVLMWNGIPTICCLHPSRDWNMYRREEYHFHATWRLIRKECPLYSEDRERIQELKSED